MTQEFKENGPPRTRKTVPCGDVIEDHEYDAPLRATVYVKNDGVWGENCNVDVQLLDSNDELVTGANFQPGEFQTLTGENVKRVLIKCMPPTQEGDRVCVVIYSLDPPP